jgi:hypothetical protein
MKYIDIDCYERGCACASSNRFAGEQCEVVEIIRYKELTDGEIEKLWEEGWKHFSTDLINYKSFARAILRKAQE